MDSRTAPGALCPRPARSQPHLGEGAAGGADPGGGRPAAWPAARRVPVWAASQTGPGRGPSGTARRRAGLGGYGQEITWGWRPAGWPARDGAWTAHPPPPPPPPPPPLLQVVVNGELASWIGFDPAMMTYPGGNVMVALAELVYVPGWQGIPPCAEAWV